MSLCFTDKSMDRLFMTTIYVIYGGSAIVEL